MEVSPLDEGSISEAHNVLLLNSSLVDVLINKEAADGCRLVGVHHVVLEFLHLAQFLHHSLSPPLFAHPDVYFGSGIH